jgi:hypothetical protein
MNENLSKKKQDEYRLALSKMSTHVGQNILFNLEYGANKFGVTLALPTDMMHANEGGLIKYVNKLFVGSMPLSVQVEVDLLIERLFVGNRQSGKDRFSRTNFSGGACSLTMLASHHWPGMTTAFLMMLLTEEGKKACKDCFAFKDEDGPKPDYNWESVPSVNIRQAYKPPIIVRDDLSAPKDSSDTDTDSNSDINDEDGDDDNDDWLYDTDDDDDDDFIIEKGTKKKIEKKTTPLQCSYRQFVNLLQEILTFHAWYRYGDPPFDHNPKQELVDNVQLRIRQLFARIITYCPRDTGYGWNIQKLHEHLHLVIHLLYFHHAMNWDAGRGERLLKPFFKDTAVTCQQRNTNVFISQLAARAQEKLVLAKAIQSISKNANYDSILEGRRELEKEQTRRVRHTFPVKTGFIITFHNDDDKCEFEWEGSNKLVQMHPSILWWMASNWWREVVSHGHGTILHCKTEYEIKGPGYERLYRAHPNYQGEGAFYDWAMVKFEDDGDYPARILLFYQKHQPIIDEQTGNVTSCGIHAIINSCVLRHDSSCERRGKMNETRLCSRWELESVPRSRLDGQQYQRGKRPNIPLMRSVPVETLQEHVYVVEEHPGLEEEWIGSRFVWTMNDQRSEWSKVFLSEDNW